MSPGILQRIDGAARRSTPLAITLLIVVLAVVPLRLPDYVVFTPRFALMAVFYWSVHRPDLMRPWGAFAVGLLDDILGGTPLGLNALVLLLVHAGLVAQQKNFHGKPFALVWCGFAFAALAATLISVALAYFLVGRTAEGPALFLQFALTVALYPIVGWVLTRAQRAFLATV